MAGKTKKSSFKVGAQIQWKWLGRNIQGEVVEVFYAPVAKVIKEKTIKRNGSVENPAYLVQSEAGNLALKLHSELQVSETEKTSGVKPKMFRS